MPLMHLECCKPLHFHDAFLEGIAASPGETIFDERQRHPRLGGVEDLAEVDKAQSSTATKAASLSPLDEALFDLAENLG